MLKGLTYRKKNKLLLLAGAMFLLLTYMLSVRNTIDACREAAGLEARSELASGAPMKAAQLKKQLEEMNSALGVQAKQENVQQALLGMVTGYCRAENTVLREFPRSVLREEKDLLVETNVFTVEGSFAQLLKLVYHIEQENRIGKVSSLRFFSKKDPKTRTTALNATIYLQNINKPGHEQ